VINAISSGAVTESSRTDTNNFNKGLNDSENRLSKFSGNAAKAGAAIALAIGTVAVGGFIKFLNVINDTEEQVRELVDTATKFDCRALLGYRN